LGVHLGRLGAVLGLLELKPPQIVACCSGGRAAEELGKDLDMADIVVLRLLAKLPDSHVLQHAGD
jgi:hypothetical protein